MCAAAKNLKFLFVISDKVVVVCSCMLHLQFVITKFYHNCRNWKPTFRKMNSVIILNSSAYILRNTYYLIHTQPCQISIFL